MALKKTRTMCTTCHARCGVLLRRGQPGSSRSRSLSRQRQVEGRVLRLGHVRARDPQQPGGPPALSHEARGVLKGERQPREPRQERVRAHQLGRGHGYHRRRVPAHQGGVRPRAIITGQGTGRVANHWHCRINSSLGLEGWSLVPTHVCLMPHILPNAFTLGAFSSAAGDMRNAHCAVLWAEPRHGDRLVQGRVQEPGRRHHEAHRHRRALPGYVQARRGPAPSSRHRCRPRAGVHARDHRAWMVRPRVHRELDVRLRRAGRAREGLGPPAGCRDLPGGCRRHPPCR